MFHVKHFSLTPVVYPPVLYYTIVTELSKFQAYLERDGGSIV